MMTSTEHSAIGQQAERTCDSVRLSEASGLAKIKISQWAAATLWGRGYAEGLQVCRGAAGMQWDHGNAYNNMQSDIRTIHICQNHQYDYYYFCPLPIAYCPLPVAY